MQFFLKERLVIVGSENFRTIFGKKSKEKYSKSLYFEGGWGQGQGQFGGKNCSANFSVPQLDN